MDTTTRRTENQSRPEYRLDESLLVNIAEALTELDDWVFWRYEQDTKGKWTKIPYQSHAPGKKASTTDPQTWNPYEDTVRAYRKFLGTTKAADGIGFVFAHGGGFVGIDLDNVIKDGRIDPWAIEIINRLKPTYHEISPSGCGIKLIARGELPAAVKRSGLGLDGKFGIEMYDSARYFTITGAVIDECRTIEDRSDAILALYDQYKTKPHETNGDTPHGPPLAGDEALLDFARKTKDPRLSKFSALFDQGDLTPGKGDPSRADFYLCHILAFWFNRDAEAVERVFRNSKLMRAKWDEKRIDTTYGKRTVAKAIEAQPEVYIPKDPRAVIDLTADLHLTVDSASIALASHDEVFRRVHELAHVVRHQGDPDEAKNSGLRRSDGTPLISPLNVPTTRTLLSRVARFRHWNKRDKEWDWKTPPKDIAEAVLGERNYPKARELVGVIEAPTLRPDGSLISSPGYDRKTGLLYIPNAIYPAIPERPTKAQVDKARDDLLYLVCDFPFRSDSDKAAWLASVLTLVARGGIDGPVPAFLVSANQAGTGKSWLATLAGLIASGRPPAMDGYAADHSEMEKILTSLAMSGDRCVVFDNAANGSAIGSPPLDRAIMARGSFRGRILGKNQQSPDVPWSATIFVTGNNLCTRDDSLRRFIPIFLEYKNLSPETRDPNSFHVYRDHGINLQVYVIMERPRLVSAALTLIRGYLILAEEPAKLVAIDFPEWERLIRQSVNYAMDTDPCGSRKDLAADDETMGERTRLVNAWKQLCSVAGKPLGLTSEEAAGKLAELESDLDNKPLIATFSSWAKRGSRLPDSMRLGILLRKHKGAPTPCGTIRNDPNRDKIACWFVE